MKQHKILILLGGCVLLAAIFLSSQNQDGEGSDSEMVLEKASPSAASPTELKPEITRRSSSELSTNQPEEIELTAPSAQTNTPKINPRAELQKRIARQIGRQSSSPSHASLSLASLLRSGGGHSSRGLVAAVESFRTRGALSTQERTAALEFLGNFSAPEFLSDVEWRWLVDELITTLRVDGTDNVELSNHLAAIATDSNFDLIVRDYALQHLGHIREEGGDPDVIDRTLRSALSETQNTLAGTALLALNRYSESSTLGVNALTIATNQSNDLRSRLTALQVAGKQGHSEALPLAVSIAGDEGQPTTLRMSAIATIGDLQAGEHASLLQQLSQSNDDRLRSAALASLSKFLP